MKKYILPIALALSLVLNIVLVCLMFANNKGAECEDNKSDQFEDINYRNTAAQDLMKQIVCADLYYPESYDPVSTKIDSAFHGPLTDPECLKAATELIKFKAQLPGAEDSYKEAVHTLKNFGSSGVFWRHAEEKDKAEERLNSLKEKIAKREEIIRQRDTSKDGKFIGWQIAHRYRAKTQGGGVSFSDVLYVVNPEMSGWSFRYSLNEFDSDNLKALDKVVRETLGLYQEED